MASKSGIARVLRENAGVVAAHAASGPRGRSLRHVGPFGVIALAQLCCAGSQAAEVARDTPTASMALATGLYASPGQSAAVSSVKTPSVTASPLPSDSPPVSTPAVVAATSVPGPAAVIAPVPLGKTPTTTGWTNYVAVIASLVGAAAGIAGMIMGGIALRRVSRRRRY